MSPKLSIVTINYNSIKDTLQLLNCLSRNSYPNLETIVVDNNSNDDLKPIQDLYPNVKLIKSKENLGFAGGNNLGLKIASGDYFMLLNNDTLVENGVFEELVRFMESDQSIGAISPMLLYQENQRIQFAGYTPIHPISIRGFALGHLQEAKDFKKSYKTPRLHGAAFLMPRRVYQQVGPMHEDYFLYYEEMDYCERIKEAGYELWYHGVAQIHHKESSSIGKNSPLKSYYMARNRILFARRNQKKGWIKIVSIAYLYGIALPKNLWGFAKQKEWRNFSAYLKGAFWHLRNLKVQ